MALTDMVLMPGADYQGICDQTRRITCETGTLKSGEVVTKLSGVPAGGGGGGTAVSPKDINFYDYDGTCVAAWSLAELAGKTALPDYPAHEGLTCQGWNWTLAGLKAENAKMNVGAMYITSDGKTRIYITLQEGRKSPMLGICPNGTVTVDWGDGTTPDTLTGTSVNDTQWTPTHNYAASGDYVIALTVDGTARLVGDRNGSSLLHYASSVDNRNLPYLNAIQRVELGSSTSIGPFAFFDCYSLASITIPRGVTNISANAFRSCYSLTQITLPSDLPSIGDSAFSGCYSLALITIPRRVTTINVNIFQNCYSLAQITLPSSVGFFGSYAFGNCYSLASVEILGSVTGIAAYAFNGCSGMAFYDFTACTAVPELSDTNAFTNIPADCEIRVPAALLDEWKAATNWATYANQIVGV